MPELYRLTDYTHVNTQVEAKHSGQEWEKVNVPTTRHELLAYLNEIAANVRGGSPLESPPAAEPQEPEVAEVDTSQTQAPAPAPPPARVEPAKITPQAIHEFILDHATTSQVEGIFACLGTRFSEMGKKAKVDD